jgi:asparagine synthase (glutamine-hydrolysing)
MEYCLAMPVEQKFNNGWYRMILRRSMKGVIPSEVQWRNDKVYYFPVAKHRFNSEKYGGNLILNKIHLIDKYVDMELINELYGKKEEINESELLTLWSIIVLLSWLDDENVNGGSVNGSTEIEISKT